MNSICSRDADTTALCVCVFGYVQRSIVRTGVCVCVCVCFRICATFYCTYRCMCVCVCVCLSLLYSHTHGVKLSVSQCVCVATLLSKPLPDFSRNLHSELTWRYLGVIVCPCCIQYCTMCVHILCVYSEWLIHYRTTYVHTKAYIIYSGKILIWRKFRCFGLFYVKFKCHPPNRKISPPKKVSSQ